MILICLHSFKYRKSLKKQLFLIVIKFSISREFFFFDASVKELSCWMDLTEINMFTRINIIINSQTQMEEAINISFEK